MHIIFLTVILASLVNKTRSWDTEELEIFDLVEEMKQNFYEIMGLTQDATSHEIKRAFRNLSIHLHPDKSDAEDANIQFRNLVSVYEVLKDPSKREKYNKVLRDGLPDWKSAVYYYRRVRKMGLVEMGIILFVILSIGQYFLAWAVYIEKKYTAEQLIGTKLKKLQRKNKSNVDINVLLDSIPTPSVFNTLPFQIPKIVWNSPKVVKRFFTDFYEHKKQEMERKKMEIEEFEKQKELEEKLIKEKEVKKEKRETIRKRRQAQKAPEKTDEELSGYSQLKIKELTEEEGIRPVKSGKTSLVGGLWTDEDLTELVRLVKKYPGGIVNRWELIAEVMNRSVSEVTFMAAKLKENAYRISSNVDNTTEYLMPEPSSKKEKVKKATTSIHIPEKSWSQEQQRALETAILKYGKKKSSDKWEKIANNVPGKTKEECILRYRHLVSLFKSQKDPNNKELEEMPEKSDEQVLIKEEHDCITNSQNQSEVHPEEKTIINNLEVLNVKDFDGVKSQEQSNKGKPCNKRKKLRKQFELSSDEGLSSS